MSSLTVIREHGASAWFMHTVNFLSATGELKCVDHVLSSRVGPLCLRVTMKDVHVLACIRTGSAAFTTLSVCLLEMWKKWARMSAVNHGTAELNEIKGELEPSRLCRILFFFLNILFEFFCVLSFFQISLICFRNHIHLPSSADFLKLFGSKRTCSNFSLS